MHRASRKTPSSLDALIFKNNKELKTISLLGLTDPDPLYQMLVDQVRQYNEMLKQGKKSQLYEQSIYQQLASVLKNIRPDNSEKQSILEQMQQWLKQKQKEVEFQKKQSELFKEKHRTKDHQLPIEQLPTQNPQLSLLGQTRMRGQPDHILPYIKGNRTAIPEIAPPAERLKQYKHKQLISMTINKPKQCRKPSRVVYKVERVVIEAKQQEPQMDIETTMPGQSIQSQIQQMPKQQMAEVPEEIEEQEEEQVDDPLKPNHKPYVEPQQSQKRQLPEGHDKAAAGMHLRYIQLINKQYRDVEEDKVVRQKYQRWAREKARAANELSRRSQAKTMRKSLSPVKTQKDELREISKTLVAQNNLSDFSKMDNDVSPQKMSCVEFEQSLFQSKICKQKKRVLKAIVMGDTEQQEPPRAPKPILRLAQVQQRKYRSLGSILDEFSPERQHAKQLQQAVLLKQKLVRDGFHNINIKQLSQGLAIPLVAQNPEAALPSVTLPHNPFFVVPKTKKKKKK